MTYRYHVPLKAGVLTFTLRVDERGKIANLDLSGA